MAKATAAAGVDGPRAVAARVQTSLYEDLGAYLAGMREAPSYAQLVTWACQDAPETVLAQVAAQLDGGGRSPRGSRRAATTTAIAPRFLPEELAVLDATRERAAADAGAAVTRTVVVAAALRVAVDRAIS